MKKQIITASLLAASYLSYSQMLSTPTLPAPLNDGVVTNNGLFNRLGHYQFNILHPYNSGWATWSTLGDIIPSGLGNTPNDPNLYGLTVNSDGDRCFFGMRNNRPGVNQGNQSDAIVAWGDDNWLNTTGNPDRMMFEFHDSNAGSGTNIREAMTLMPNPANNGVWVGVNQHTPGNTMEINSTQYASACLTNGQPPATGFGAPTGWAGMRFTDLTSGCIPQNNPGRGALSVNANGDVIYVPVLSNANNGLSVVNGVAQLGVVCPATGAQLTATQLLSTRQIPTNGFNLMINGTGRVGIGKPNNTCAPGNKLEVDNATPGNTSGLRLTDLAGQNGGAANGKVLSVNASGDVILTQAPTTAAFGNNCTATTKSPLTSTWEIPMATFNYVFTGQGINQTNVGIGTGCTPSAKLHVNQTSGSTVGSTGLLVENNDIGPCNNVAPVIGLKSVVNLLNSASTVGDNQRIGAWLEVPNPNGCGVINNYALVIPQGGGYTSIGYSPAQVVSGGLLSINGTAYAVGGWQIGSDLRLKKNVQSITTALDKIKQLRAVTFEWNKPNGEAMQGTHSGFIAQELEKVIPHAVTTDKNGLKGVFYDEIIPYLVNGMQEQQAQIENQQKQIDELKELVKSLANAGTPKDDNSRAVNLSDKNVLVLNQNVPNPFAESTVITYNIPTDFTKAQLIFTTIDGKVINTVEVTTKGEGRLNVFANDLSSGMYSYTLVVDGKTIDTKKMVKQ